jgi:hypothetical protein
MHISKVVETHKNIKKAIDIVQLIDAQIILQESNEAKEKLSELIEILHKTETDIGDFHNFVTETDKNKEQAQLELEVHYDEPYYWRVFELGIDGPYCQNCYDSSAKLIRLQEEIRGAWLCLACSSNYKDITYKKE